MKPIGKILAPSAALAFGFIVFGIVAEIGLRLIYPEWREYSARHFIEPETVKLPGRTPVAIARRNYIGGFAQNNGDFRTVIRTNEDGLRNDLPSATAAGRTWIIGDSMAFGWGVQREQTYTAWVERLTGRETYNVASPGADICGYQTLAARMRTAPTAVIVGLIIENDMRVYDCPGEAVASQAAQPPGRTAIGIHRLVTEIKVSLTDHSALYNVVAVAMKRLPVVTDTLIRMGLIELPHRDYGEAAGRDDQRVVDTSAAELDRLRAMFPDMPFVVLLAPSRFELTNPQHEHGSLRQATVAALEARGIDVIDLFPVFAAEPLHATHFAHDGHWNAHGHELAGQAVAAYVRARDKGASR